jgi:hypothetical protein
MIIHKYKKPVTFYVLASVIPWGLWFAAGYASHITPATQQLQWVTSVLSLLGLIAPVGVALYLIYPHKELRSDFMSRIFNFKEIRSEYILITCFLMLISILSAQAISLLFGYSESQFQITGTFTFTSGVLPVWFMLLIAPIFEELAWHSYGTDALRSKFNLFTTSVLFAVFWGIWHFPLSSIKDYYHSNLVESGLLYSINFVVSLVPFVLIMNWIYYKSNRNILLTIIFHITAGYFNEIFATHPMSKVIQTGLLLILSAYLLVKEKEMFFTSPKQLKYVTIK